MNRGMEWIRRCRVLPQLRRVLTVVLVALGLLTGLEACNSPPPPEDGVTDVSIRNFSFSPKTVTLRQGESVRWTNGEITPVTHTTTSGSPDADDAGDMWDSGNLAPGQSFTRRFDEVGEFTYFCDVHEDMASMRDAKVIVEAADAP